MRIALAALATFAIVGCTAPQNAAGALMTPQTVSTRVQKLKRVGDGACLVASGLFITLLVLSLVAPKSATPLARHVSADGTTYILTTDDSGLVFAHQSVTPKSSGALVANVEQLTLISITDGGQDLPGMKSSLRTSVWMPSFRSDSFAWFRGHGVSSGVGPVGMPLMIFRVNFTTLCLPSTALMILSVISLAPLVGPYLRRRFAAKPGLCAKCGYDLRASPERCPECGTVAASALRS